MDKWIQLQSSNGEDNLFPVGKMDLLWKNSAPTSAFTAQTVAIDLSKYDAVLVSGNGSGYQSTLSDTSRETVFAWVNGKDCVLLGHTQSTILGVRTFTINTNGIVFNGGYYVGTSGGTANNYAAVPKDIYGIKLGIADLT